MKKYGEPSARSILWLCTYLHGGISKSYILSSESFTRWLVWGAGDGAANARDSSRTSTQELGKIEKFLPTMLGSRDPQTLLDC